MENNSNDDITDLIPQFVLDEVNARGFYLYEWISFKNYIESIIKFYLKPFNFLIMTFSILTPFILFLLSIVIKKNIYLKYNNIIPEGRYLIKEILENGYHILYSKLYLLISEIYIFINDLSLWRFIFILFFLLTLERTLYFLKYSNIVFTEKHILIFGKILNYNKIFNFSNKIKYFSKYFGVNNFNKNNSSIGFKYLWFILSVTFLKLNYFHPINIWKRKNKYLKNNNTNNELLSGITLTFLFIIGIPFFILYMILIVNYIFCLSLLLIGLSFGILNIFFVYFLSFLINGKKNKISKLFKTIDKDAKLLLKIKNNIFDDINNILNINAPEIENNFINFSKIAFNTIVNINKLEKTIKNSKYKDIFNFSIFYNWITNQIRAPLVEIRSLLTNHFEILQKSITSLEDQIKTTQDNIKGPLELQLKRLQYATASSESRVNELNEMIEKITF